MLTIGTFHFPSVLLSLFSWCSLYFTLRHLQPHRKAEWHCRTVTVCHAVLVTLLSFWSGMIQGPWPFTDAGGPNTPLQVTTTTICLGYFIFDFTWCLYFQTEGPPMLLHHSLSLLGLTWVLVSGKLGTEMMATVCGSEATNPLLQLRWFLRETGRYHTVLGEITDVAFMLSFFALRIGVGTVLIYSYFLQPTEFMGRFGAVAIYLIGWMFWVSIFRYAVRKYTKKYRAWRGVRQKKSEPPSGAACSTVGGEELSRSLLDEGDTKSSSDESFSREISHNGDGVVPKEQKSVSKNGVRQRGNVTHKHSNGTLHDGRSAEYKGVRDDCIGGLSNGVLANG
ncbi:TLC domain-containing protein 5-like [Littorina saxatilis]|uniref:TLC domain-containing protein 5-like n=1 Tax=Littorina saxatilis TaxID=31220 RepID=UPI0038B6304D